MWRKLKAYLDLVRPEQGLILAASFVVSLLIAGGGMPLPGLLVAGVVSITAAQMGAFALNDYFDVGVDLHNQRLDRPLVRGDLAPGEALAVSGASFAVSILASLFLNHLGASIVILFLILLSIFYDYRLKEFGLLGNLYIAFTMAAPFLFSSVLFSGPPILLLFAATVFVAGLGREIMIGIPDAKGDALREVKTVARVYGEKSARGAATILYLGAILLFLAPLLLQLNLAYYLNPVYAVLVVPLAAILLYVCTCLLVSSDVKVIGRAGELVLMVLAVALLTYLLPVLTG